MSEDQLNSCLNLMRRMPPSATENSLAGLIELQPDLTDDLLTNVDQPLGVEKDPVEGKDFVKCDYSRDGDSYRSPWSNKYYPALNDGFLPSKKLRDMEVTANALLATYLHFYFESGCSSAYFFDTEEGATDQFGACWLVHKDVEGGNLKSGWWDSTHVFAVTENSETEATYELTTTVMISMVLVSDQFGNIDLSGIRTRQKSAKMKVDKYTSHVSNMGKMLEETELKIRNEIEGIYIQKTREVINGMRSTAGKRDQQFASIMQDLAMSLPSKK